MKKVLCPECGKLMVPVIAEAVRKAVIRGEEFEVTGNMPKCTECGREFISGGIENNTYTLATEQYRKKHNLLDPAEIKQIREKYGLSPKPFARLLGWGELTVYKYETGALQDDVHDEVFKLIKDPEIMKMLYDSKQGIDITESERQEFESALLKLLREVNPYERVLKLKFSYPPDEYSGKRPFDVKKALNLVLKILHCSGNSALWEVQLLKCMFYADFLNFKDSGISITGLQYANGPYGPIPNDYHTLFDYMKSLKLFEIEIIPNEAGEGHRCIPLKKSDDTVFSGAEASLIKQICEKLTPLGSKKLSDKTHKEVEGWKATKTGQLISYAYAERIKPL